MTAKDERRLQFIISRINFIGLDGVAEELKCVPWTVYRHDADVDRTSMGFDRKAIDRWMKLAAARGAKMPYDPNAPRQRRRRKSTNQLSLFA